jgi:alpha-L-rhamnosidase
LFWTPDFKLWIVLEISTKKPVEPFFLMGCDLHFYCCLLYNFNFNFLIMHSIRSIFLISLVWFLLSCNTRQVSKDINSGPYNLRCEYYESPLGIDNRHPLITWQIDGTNRLKEFQVIVSSTAELAEAENGDVWNTGKMLAGDVLGLVYNGPDLESSKRYYWRVKYWDEKGNASSYSDTGWFETGLLEQNDWKAKWIRADRLVPVKDIDFYKEIPAPLFRKDFNLEEEVKSARLYISGLGYFESFINGKRISEDVLHPGWTNYAKRVLYSTYDVTDLLNNGENIIGISLGNGWYDPLPLRLFSKYNLREHLTTGRPKLIAQLLITYKNGKQKVVVSDDSWRWDEGPILKNNVYLGEVYDMRREQPGWNKIGFNESEWGTAVIADAPAGELRAQLVPPNRITKVLEPVALSSPATGIYVFDIGQNFAGWINFKVRGKEGQKIKMRFGELLFENGRVNGFTTVAGQIKEDWQVDGGPGAPKTAWQEDVFILKGEGEETFQHHFTFRGFRYVEVSGLTEQPEKSDLKGLRINSDLKAAGSFSCSNPLFNNIQKIVEWTFLSNVFSVESDCPAREKFGYGGDIVAAGEAYIYNFDMANFYKKAIRDFQFDARSNGGLTECAPFNGIGSEGFENSVGPIGWQLAHPFMLKKIYQYYGDKAFVEAQYTTAVRLAEFLRSQAKDQLIYHGIGDHESIDPKPTQITSSAFYYHIVRLTSELAGILDKKEDQKRFDTWASEIKQAFISRYYKGGGCVGDHPTQATQSFALYYDLLPEGGKGKAFEILEREIVQTHNGHLATGIFGTKMMFDVLREYGRNDLAYTIVNQKDFPGYGNMIEKGATTLWEHWQFSDNTFSHNHPMFGSVSEWFYKGLGGIYAADDAVGFNKIVIRPASVEDLKWVRCSYQSIRGPVVSNWKREGNKFEMEVIIPGGTSALVYVPVKDAGSDIIKANGEKIFENGKPVKEATLKWVRTTGEAVVFAVNTGHYHISSMQ